MAEFLRATPARRVELAGSIRKIDNPRAKIVESWPAGTQEDADSVIRDELAAQWVTGPFTICPPWEPCRSLPQNVAMQTKLKVNAATREVSYVPKPRVTTNGSAEAKGKKRGAVVLGGLNQGVPAAETAVALDTAGPAPQCGGGGHRLVLRAGCAQAPDLNADQGRAVCSG